MNELLAGLNDKQKEAVLQMCIRDSSYAAVSPAGPAPITITFFI